MTCTWVIEKDIFNEGHYDRVIEVFRERSIPFNIVEILPSEHSVIGKTPCLSNPVIVYGSIGAQKLAERMGWVPGVWTSDRFSETAYAPILGNRYVNSDLQLMRMTEVMEKADLGEFFIKPNTDTKEFAGFVTSRGEFRDWYQRMIDIGYLENNDFDVCVSAPKKIVEEHRYVIVDGEVITGSVYRKYGVVYKKKLIITDVERLFFGDLIKVFEPAPVYVCDIGIMEDGSWKVVEYGTVNTAGFYDCDIEQIVVAITQFVEDHYV